MLAQCDMCIESSSFDINVVLSVSMIQMCFSVMYPGESDVCAVILSFYQHQVASANGLRGQVGLKE